jgi:hypothetical protein
VSQSREKGQLVRSAPAFQTPARIRAQAVAKARMNNAQAHYIISGEKFATIRHIRIRLSANGVELTDHAIRNRLRRGDATWDALSRPRARRGQGPEQKQIKLRELEAAISALDARKKALKGS